MKIVKERIRVVSVLVGPPVDYREETIFVGTLKGRVSLLCGFRRSVGRFGTSTSRVPRGPQRDVVIKGLLNNLYV